jgi:hypothetical protein
MCFHEREASESIISGLTEEDKMWRMIKADIEYNRTLFIFLYSIVFVSFLANSIRGDLEEFLSIVMFFSVILIGTLAGIEEVMTKRVRFFSVLPLQVRQVGILRYPIFLAYWFSLMILLWLSSLVSQQGHLGLDYLWWILTRTGSMFLMVAFMDLGQDLPFCVRGKVPGVALKLIAILFGIFGGPFIYFATNAGRQSDPIFISLSEVFITASGAIGLFFFSLVMILVSIFVYEQRRSYTE